MEDDWLAAVEREANLAKFDRMTRRLPSLTNDEAGHESGSAGPAGTNGANSSSHQPTQAKSFDRDSAKENQSPGGRRRRKLPNPSASFGNGGGGGLRRAQSLSFLPSVGDPSNSERSERIRRRLPDPGQGRLIQEVADKLEEEAQVRLEVAKELKEEKRKRWKLEDIVSDLQTSCSKIRDQLDEKKRECQVALQEVEDERKLRLLADGRAEANEKELRRLKLEVQRLRDTHDSAADDAVFGEQALKDAWEATFTEKKLRQEAQENFEALKRGILKSGGIEVFQQLLKVGAGLNHAPSPLPARPESLGPDSSLSPGLKYESIL